jgi:ABC-type nickel/cobalt efflux system permease component RcnA
MKGFSPSTKSSNRTKSLAMMILASALIAAMVVVLCLSAPASAQTSPFGAAGAAPVTGFAGWVLAEQAIFYRALSGTILAAKSNGSALWTLMGIAFVYGVFHAAGPGHGKAVISSYLLANDETWRRGVTLSFASALVQSLTAVLIVGFAAILLGATAKMMGDAVRAIEITSYGLIILLGARLLWVKGLGLLRAAAALGGRDGKATGDDPDHHAVVLPSSTHPHHDPHDAPDALARCGHDHRGSFACQRCDHDHGHVHDHRHDHAHGHDHEPNVLPWGHAHGPEPQELRGPGGWKRGLWAIIAVGLRPCSGAIILLVFALSQGLFWAGVVSTFVMGLGTAMTVAAIATLAVSAKAFVRRFATEEIGYGSILLRSLEVGAAALVLVFGILLLAGYMASERLVGF